MIKKNQVQKWSVVFIAIQFIFVSVILPAPSRAIQNIDTEQDVALVMAKLVGVIALGVGAVGGTSIIVGELTDNFALLGLTVLGSLPLAAYGMVKLQDQHPSALQFARLEGSEIIQFDGKPMDEKVLMTFNSEVDQLNTLMPELFQRVVDFQARLDQQFKPGGSSDSVLSVKVSDAAFAESLRDEYFSVLSPETWLIAASILRDQSQVRIATVE